jgi:hypothetical protein
MNDSTRVIRRPRRASPPTARTAAAIVSTAALALLSAACSGSPSSTGSGGSSNAGGSANSPSAVGYSHCMRSHGVPNYPDPDSSNTLRSGLPKVSPQQLGVTNSRFQAAENACRHLLPAGARTSQGQDQQVLSKLLRFAQCMRSHGAPNWPDPTPAPGQIPPFTFNIHGLQGVENRSWSPQINTAFHECQRLIRSQVAYNGGGP